MPPFFPSDYVTNYADGAGQTTHPGSGWTVTDASARDGEDDWIGLGAGTSAFAAQVASSQRVLGQPAVTFGSVSDTDADGLDDNCDQCPTTSGAGAHGCP